MKWLDIDPAAVPPISQEPMFGSAVTFTADKYVYDVMFDNSVSRLHSSDVESADDSAGTYFVLRNRETIFDLWSLLLPSVDR